MNCFENIAGVLLLLSFQVGELPAAAPMEPPIPAPSEADLREFEYLISGMSASREAISSAVVTYTGRRFRVKQRSPSENLDGPISGTMAFDMIQNNLRIKHSMPESYGPSVSSNQLQTAIENGSVKELATGPYLQTDQYMMFVRNKSYAAHYARTGRVDSNLDIGPVDWSLAHSKRDLLHLIDLRSLGMIDVQDFSGWTPLIIWEGTTTEIDNSSLLCPLETIVHNLKVRNWFRLIRESGLVTIDWGTHRLTINEDEGFTPVEYSTTDEYWKLLKCKYVSRTSWTQVGEHWVPSTAVLEMVDEKDETEERFELKLEWDQINGELKDELFQYESFEDVNDYTMVIDSRPETKGRLGEWVGGKIQSKIDAEPARRSGSIVMICALCVPLFLVLGLIWKRSRSQLPQT